MKEIVFKVIVREENEFPQRAPFYVTTTFNSGAKEGTPFKSIAEVVAYILDKLIDASI